MERVHAMVSRAVEQDGFHLLTGGGPLGSTARYDFSQGGSFYPPTLLSGGEPGGSLAAEKRLRASEIWRDEVFGPVVILVPFRDEDHAVELANDCQYGLGASVWTESVSDVVTVCWPQICS